MTQGRRCSGNRFARTSIYRHTGWLLLGGLGLKALVDNGLDEEVETIVDAGAACMFIDGGFCVPVAELGGKANYGSRRRFDAVPFAVAYSFLLCLLCRLFAAVR